MIDNKKAKEVGSVYFVPSTEPGELLEVEQALPDLLRPVFKAFRDNLEGVTHTLTTV